MERLRSTSAGRWWLVWVSGGRKWVLGSSKAVNAACLVIFDPSTNSTLSRQPESVEKLYMRLYGLLRLISEAKMQPRPTTAALGSPPRTCPRRTGSRPRPAQPATLRIPRSAPCKTVMFNETNVSVVGISEVAGGERAAIRASDGRAIARAHNISTERVNTARASTARISVCRTSERI
jgi:hypothetical protein